MSYNDEPEMQGIVVSMKMFDQFPPPIRQLVAEQPFNLVISPEVFMYLTVMPLPQIKTWMKKLAKAYADAA